MIVVDLKYIPEEPSSGHWKAAFEINENLNIELIMSEIRQEILQIQRIASDIHQHQPAKSRIF